MSLPLAPSKKYIMIEKFKNELKSLKNTLNEIQKLKILREKEINEIKNETKRKFNMLDDEKDDILEKLDVDLTTLELRCRFCENSYDFEKERKLRLSSKERINEIKRLKEEAENNKDKLLNHLLDSETNSFKLLTDLEYIKMMHCIIL